MSQFNPTAVIILGIALTLSGCSRAPSEKLEPAQESQQVSSRANRVEDMADHVESEKESKEDAVPTLTVGDMAPPLKIAKWMKGNEIEEFQPGQIYVVEFWATWCGPCRLSMPHLGEVQTEYGDKLRIVGVSDEEPQVVEKFLADKGDGDRTWDEIVTYALAIDMEGATSKAYLNAAKAMGIPTAFVVGRDGKIDWIGHPIEMDAVLENVVDGNWDRAAARRGHLEQVASQADEIAIIKAISGPLQSGNYEAALAALDNLAGDTPNRPNLQKARFRVLVRAGRFEDALQMLQDAAKNRAEKDSMLNELAWMSAGANDTSFLQDVLRIVQQVHLSLEEPDSELLTAMARLHFALNQQSDAVFWQEKAADINPSPFVKKQLELFRQALEESNRKAEATQEAKSKESDADANEKPSATDEQKPDNESDGTDNTHAPEE